MKYIIVDLEMNRISKKFEQERRICGKEIIEIGAVVLDDSYQEMDAFKTLVKPQYNEQIEEYYSNLTGITTQMVQNAPVFEVALKQFLDWCDKMDDEIQIVQWSENDLIQIIEETELKQVELNEKAKKLLLNWYDLQKECGDKLKLENAVSLKNAIMYAGFEFEGHEHDALDDARNTAILMKILRIPELCKKALEKVIEALTPKEIGTSIGALFDFSLLPIGV